jgi:hypothetical protein
MLDNMETGWRGGETNRTFNGSVVLSMISRLLIIILQYN